MFLTHNSQLTNSQLTTHNSQLTTHNSQLTTHNSQLTTQTHRSSPGFDFFLRKIFTFGNKNHTV